MAEIQPFTALRYRADIDLGAATCPPYDVLSPEARRALFDRSPYATVRLILPEGEGDTRYRNAAEAFSAMLQGGVLVEDSSPGLYVIKTDYTEPGTDGSHLRTRLGLIGLLRLHEYQDRVVLPHERTLTGPKEDRLKLLEATRANFESIMGLVDDESGALYAGLKAATEAPPLADFTGDDSHHHTLYKLDDPAAITALGAFIGPKQVFIADGHHRYETAVAYARAQGALGTSRPEAFLLATLHSSTDPGLAVLPTHRLIRGTEPDMIHTLFTRLEPLFDIQEVDLPDLEGRLRLNVQNQPVFGLVLGTETVFYQLIVRDASRLAPLLPADVSPALRGLEAVILQHLVMEPALGIAAADVATTDRVAYTRDTHEAVARVRDGEFDMAFLLGRPGVTSVRDVSLEGGVMPQKSTFFYPKLVSGLVMRRF